MDSEVLNDPNNLLHAAQVMLAAHPHAFIGAFETTGLLTELPAELAESGNPVFVCRTLLDLVLPEDRAPLGRAWVQLMRAGGSQVRLHFASEAGPVGMILSFFDLQARYGIRFGIAIPHEEDGSETRVDAVLEAVGIMRPRFARLEEDDGGVVTACDEAATHMLGWEADEMIGRAALDIVHPDDHARGIDVWIEMMVTRRSRRMRLRHLRKDKTWLWTEVEIGHHLDDQGRSVIYADLMDISEEMSAQEALRDREELLDRLAEALPVGLLQVTTDRRVVYSNERLHEILGSRANENLGSRANENLDSRANENLDDLLSNLAHKGRSIFDVAVCSVLELGQPVDIEVELKIGGVDGYESRQSSMSLRSLRNDSGAITGAIVCVSDITDSKRMRVELENRATYDSLSKCYNRATTFGLLEQALERSETQDHCDVVVAFIDLDNLKPVNDVLGHGVGDEVLVGLADRVRSALHSQEFLGRMGGDEFLAVSPGSDSPERATDLMSRIEACLSDPLHTAGGPIQLQASIGLAVGVGGEVDADELVATADAAMYQAKRAKQGISSAALSTPRARSAKRSGPLPPTS